MEGSYNPIKNSELLDDPESMIFALADASPREILPIIFLCLLRNALICLMFSGGDDSGSRLQAFNEEEMAFLRSDPFSFSSPVSVSSEQVIEDTDLRKADSTRFRGGDSRGCR